MSATPREIVLQTLNFQNPARVPRDLWTLPVAIDAYPSEYAAILRDFPMDLLTISGHESQQPPTKGDWYEVGEFIDPWGCIFTNVQKGIVGEVKTPLVNDWVADRAKIHVPREWLTLDRDAINRDCAGTDLFTRMGQCPRPFEQLQFIRGTENMYIDLADPDPGLLAFMKEMHDFYCELLTAWSRTDVDALNFMDDWGSQRSLLISPAMWREYFKPMYRDYCQIARSHDKKIFMHSDGYIVDIYPDLIEVGVDAVNSQIFCMGVDALKPFAGKITFWGEIDRQHLLPAGTLDEIGAAVRSLYAALWENGGCIAQCEFGAAAKPENARQVYASWAKIKQ